jgi:hypothetical protein
MSSLQLVVSLSVSVAAVIAAHMQEHGSYTVEAAVGAIFTLVGLGMALNVRGFGEKVVSMMVALGVALGSGEQARKIAQRERAFSIVWGVIALLFGVGAIVFAVLR